MSDPCKPIDDSPRPRHQRPVLAFLCAQALLLSGRARAEEACRPEYRAGPSVWYAAETQPRVDRTFASGCGEARGGHPEVRYFMRGTRQVIACDLELALPDAMKADLGAAQLQVATALPSRSQTLASAWKDLVRRYSRDLPCAEGSQRMSDTSSGVPSVWCRRQLTATELCPRGSTFSEGACTTTACPEGTVDLERSTAGRLAGCSSCPAGTLDVEESVAWRDQARWSSSSRGPDAAVLCKARATDPCPRLRESARSPDRGGGGGG